MNYNNSNVDKYTPLDLDFQLKFVMMLVVTYKEKKHYKDLKGKGLMQTYGDSPWCMAETNTTLESYYPSIKNKFAKKNSFKELKDNCNSQKY